MLHFVDVGDPKFGIRIYKDAVKTSECAVKTLEKSDLSWLRATVGRNQTMLDYRNCWDCKLSPSQIGFLSEDFQKAYSEIVLSIGTCVENYARSYNLKLTYMEAVNFVKYGVGEHFDVHSDHGYSYICTVSSVTYLNDDYEGGELWFKHLDYTIKPEKGDIVVFPSTFIYSHASLPVKSGLKYSAVTMFDYNDAAHKNGGYAS